VQRKDAANAFKERQASRFYLALGERGQQRLGSAFLRQDFCATASDRRRKIPWTGKRRRSAIGRNFECSSFCTEANSCPHRAGRLRQRQGIFLASLMSAAGPGRYGRRIGTCCGQDRSRDGALDFVSEWFWTRILQRRMSRALPCAARRPRVTFDTHQLLPSARYLSLLEILFGIIAYSCLLIRKCPGGKPTSVDRLPVHGC